MHDPRPLRADAGRVEIVPVRRTVRLLLFLIPIVVGGFAAGTGSADAGRSPLAEKLDELAKRKPLAGASVGMLVVRERDGAVVYSRGADQLLIPASNQKVLTSLAALSRFGPTHRFTTRIWTRGEPDAAGVVSGLLVEGGGDPATNSEDWWRMAADLRRKGLRGVRGDVVVDDARFEAPGWHPSWGRITARAYHAPVGALTANYGLFVVAIGPGAAAGQPASVAVDPPIGYLRLRNEAATVARGKGTRLLVDRARGRADGEAGRAEETVIVEGTARVGDEIDVVGRSVLDPGLYAGSVLAHQLEANGIFVDGRVRRGDRRTAAWTLYSDAPGARNVAEIVKLCMKWSNNSIAESLLKNLGAWDGASVEGEPAAQGDWAGGVRALRAELTRLGVDLGDARLVDGSGLSIQNRISPRIVVEALQVGRRSFRFGPEFVASLPIAERDGTLERRLEGRDGRIRAKTGLLGDAKATSLSGFAERGDGETLVFAILVNGFSGGSGAAMDAVDRLAGVLLDLPLTVPGAPAP